jgi:Cu-Zn family superoxide dismutase
MPARKSLQTLGLVTLLAAASGCAPENEAAAPDTDVGAAAVEPEPDATVDRPARARAELEGAPQSGVSGSVEVVEEPGGVRVVAHVSGVEAMGPHGIHVHTTGACAPPDFTSAGDHLNPEGAPHACPPTAPRHAGDLGNLEVVEGGDGHLELTTDLLTVAPGPASVVGRAIVLHQGSDDCTTQPSGDSGDRLACGVFELDR